MSRKVLAKFFNFLKIKKKTINKKQTIKTNIHWCERRDMSAATQQEMRSAMWVSKRKLQEIMMEERGRREKEKKRREQVSERRLHCRRGKENSTKFK